MSRDLDCKHPPWLDWNRYRKAVKSQIRWRCLRQIKQHNLRRSRSNDLKSLLITDGEIDFEEQFHRTISSPVIKNDLLIIPDFSGLVHCLNAKTGTPYGTCDLLAACWGTPLIVEDKVYVGDEDGDVAIFDLSPDPTESVDDGLLPIHEVYMGNSVYQTPIVANNVLYIANKKYLFAIETKAE